MKKPIIGISPVYDTSTSTPGITLPKAYLKAIEDAGGIPIVLSLWNGLAEVKRILEMVDGIMLTGGNDILPALYGADFSEHCGSTTPERDEAEIMLAKAAFKNGTPLLGICRGCQMLNVAMGGTLWQDIPTEAERTRPIRHEQRGVAPFEYPTHSVRISKDSHLYKFHRRETLMVNSSHHQAPRKVATSLVATAHADDGIVEAIESASPDRFLLGVQWHPEQMFHRDEDARELFRFFIAAAAK